MANYNCTKSFRFDLKCTKISSGWGSTPDPAGGAYRLSDLQTIGSPSCERMGVEGEDRGDKTEEKGRRLSDLIVKLKGITTYKNTLKLCVCSLNHTMVE